LFTAVASSSEVACSREYERLGLIIRVTTKMLQRKFQVCTKFDAEKRSGYVFIVRERRLLLFEACAALYAPSVN